MSISKQRKILTPELRVQIGGRIEEWMRIKGLRMTEFAAIVEKNPVDARKYLDGRLDPQGLFVALRHAGCDLNWLADGSGPAPKPALGASLLEYEFEEEEKQVEAEVSRIVKIVQLSSSTMTPVQSRELHEALRRWALKRYRGERKETGKPTRK